MNSLLTKVDFPVHQATYRAALDGHPLKNDKWLRRPLEEEDAKRIARMAMWYALLRINK